MLPLYMFMTGYSVLDIGIVFTVVNILSIPVVYLIGRVFDQIAIRHGLVLIDGLDGVAYILYGLSYGPLAPLMLALGILFEKISGWFYHLYPAAEKLLYPRERIEEIYAWHMRLPEISQLVGFLLLGYLFGYIYNTPESFRTAFLLFGLSSVFTMAYLWLFLPRLDKKERVEPEPFVFRIDREFKIILVIEALLTIGWSLAPEFVILNYIVNVLGLTLFEVMLIEAAISLGAIAATYVSERIERKHMFKAMGLGYTLLIIWAAIMYIGPSLPLAILAYFIGRFGETLSFPFHRSWILRKIPRDKVASILAAISSYRRIIVLTTPFIAGLLATIQPTLPYLVSLATFTMVSIIFLGLSIHHKPG